MIIKSYFGSLIDFSQKVRKMSEVAQLLGIHYNTTRIVIVRFIERGYRLINMRSFNGRPRQIIKSEMFEKFLLDPHTIETWAHLSLIERTQKLEREYKVKISHSRLRRFYRKHNISYTKPPTFIKHDIANSASH